DCKSFNAPSGETFLGARRVIFPFTCSGSKRKAVPVSSPTFLSTVWMSAFSKVKAISLVAQVASRGTRRQRQSNALSRNLLEARKKQRSGVIISHLLLTPYYPVRIIEH